MVGRRRRTGRGRRKAPRFAAIDLGTNNCRLLIATPTRRAFRIVDGYSRIVRLGEGLAQSGELSGNAIDRTLEALQVCARKIQENRVVSARCIATEACRAASNGEAFMADVREVTGLSFDIVPAAEEAALSVRGCTDLIADDAHAAIVFDIGGGSTEISWLRIINEPDGTRRVDTVAWTSLPMGVVTLAERFGGTDLSAAAYDEIVDEVARRLRDVSVPSDIRNEFSAGHGHHIGTSGTMTSLAGVHLDLAQYARSAVDGVWLTSGEILTVTERVRNAPFDVRADHPCIGAARADLVVPGCAILSGIHEAWPTPRVRVGDRGLREGLLMDQIDTWRRSRKTFSD